MLNLKSAITLVAFAACVGAAHAKDKEPITDCVDLTTGHQMTRFGSQYLLVKDGDSYYRVGFAGNCSAIAVSTKVQITTDGQANRLCPKDTRVATPRDSCTAREVLRVDEDQYETYARKRR